MALYRDGEILIPGHDVYRGEEPDRIWISYESLAISADARDDFGVTEGPDPEVEPAVPVEVMRYQAKIVMVLATLGSLGLDGSALGLPPEATLWEAVEAAITTLPEPDRTVAAIQFESAPGFRRDSPLLSSLAPALGLTWPIIDELFIQAAAVV